MRRHARLHRLRVITIVSLLTLGLLGSHGGAIANATVTSKTTVMASRAVLTEAEVLAWFNARTTSWTYRASVPEAELIRLYRQEGERIGIRWDVAFAQSIIETAWFNWPSTGQVKPTDNNFAGMGAYDGSSGTHVFKFPDARTGVLAQMQHLRLYSDPNTATDGSGLGAPLAQDIDNRYPDRWRLVRNSMSNGEYLYAGRVPLWEDFGGGMWATDPFYSCKVLNIYRQMLAFNGKKTDGLPTNPTCLRTWHYRNQNTGGSADSLGYLGREGDTVLACDWNGNGRDTPATFNRGSWRISNQQSGGGAHVTVTYGRAGDLPLCGDWNGDGRDTIGIVRDGEWHLKNSLSGGSSDISFTYGRVTRGDIPIVGDWNGNGRDTVGIIRDGEWHLRNTLSGGAGQIVFVYGRIISLGDRPLIGDWNGDGKDTIGIVRDREWHLRNSLSGGKADNTFIYGRVASGDVPLMGDWNGNGQDTPAIVR